MKPTLKLLAFLALTALLFWVMFDAARSEPERCIVAYRNHEPLSAYCSRLFE
jgi:hypothetical protein